MPRKRRSPSAVLSGVPGDCRDYERSRYCMILSGKEIQKQVIDRNIVIRPFDPKKVNPNSYNLTLHNELRCMTLLFGYEESKSNEEYHHSEGRAFVRTWQAVSGAHQRIYTNRQVCSYAGRQVIHGTAGALHPCNGRFWRYWFCRVLDVGNPMHSPFGDLSGYRGVPDLLPYH